METRVLADGRAHRVGGRTRRAGGRSGPQSHAYSRDLDRSGAGRPWEFAPNAAPLV